MFTKCLQNVGVSEGWAGFHIMWKRLVTIASHISWASAVKITNLLRDRGNVQIILGPAE